ncbi:hypothetical protein DSO57_1035290 [Entomophthora muscae]|uniref:Uncharacterized protein n=1 Tax=Entomophthora muscae TaxID=34485 RepID=A0ACC2SZR8_9FUNG|nr:hypothetical protein DSO57_1035290 [Entomophthora muscae]
MIYWLSELSGINENALRLLFSVLAGYPIALAYRNQFLGPIASLSDLDASHVRNNYLVVTGLGLSFFYNRWDIIHSLLTVAGTYAICVLVGNFLKNRFLSACLIFLFNITYLLCGYVANSGTEYDLTWTMPQCVLCLRMIGFGMDYYDGESLAHQKADPDSKASEESKPEQPAKVVSAPGANKTKAPVSFGSDTPLEELPRFLHFVGYAYFFSAFLVGPQFSFSLYQKFIEGKSLTPDKDGKLPEGASQVALRCFLKGLSYLALQQILDAYYPSSFLFTAEFRQLSFFRRVFVVWFTGRTMINKYLGVWALNEGSCVLSGIAFNGYNSQGEAEWDGLTNIDTYSFETATSLTQIVSCFNINTNFWIKQYIFKRLRFLKSKELSQLGSLFFLALWHGFASGYFACFLLEFADMWVEQRTSKVLSPRTQWIHSSKSPLRYVLNFMCYLYTSGALFYAIISFGLLRFELYQEVYQSIYYVGHLILFAIVGLASLLPRPSRKAVSSADTAKKSQ